jgi:hypothetical protein
MDTSNFDPNSPMASLSALLEAVKLSHGEAGVMHVLDKIKAATSSGVSASESYAVAEAALNEMLKEARDSSILITEGSGVGSGILEAAYRDGSSVICKNCGGLIARERWSNHVDFWCGKELEYSDESDKDEFEDARMEED